MKNLIAVICLFIFGAIMNAQDNFQTDIVKTSKGDLKVTFLGHATLLFEFNKTIIHVDPWSRMADYSKLPKADIILITHQHPDHLDVNAINLIKKSDTKLFCNGASLKTAGFGTAMKNGDSEKVNGIHIDAVPAYNIVNKRENGAPFHPKGEGNGYVLTFGDKKVYVAGDTENVPEMKELKNIDITFLPMNLPYTMTPAMVADAVKMFNPKILYPYHYGNTNINELLDLLKDKKDCEIRVRKMN